MYMERKKAIKYYRLRSKAGKYNIRFFIHTKHEKFLTLTVLY